jgi:hypothetical protein
MVHLSATRCSCIAILWVSLVSFAAITLCAASQRVFIAISLLTQSGKFWIHPHICHLILEIWWDLLDGGLPHRKSSTDTGHHVKKRQHKNLPMRDSNQRCWCLSGQKSLCALWTLQPREVLYRVWSYGSKVAPEIKEATWKGMFFWSNLITNGRFGSDRTKIRVKSNNDSWFFLFFIQCIVRFVCPNSELLLKQQTLQKWKLLTRNHPRKAPFYEGQKKKQNKNLDITCMNRAGFEPAFPDSSCPKPWFTNLRRPSKIHFYFSAKYFTGIKFRVRMC